MGRNGYFVVNKKGTGMMTQHDKITELSEIFEINASEIVPGKSLDSLRWDSMAMLSVIAMANEKCGKRISGAEIKKMRTIQDILDVLD